MLDKKHFPYLAYNRISAAGAVVALVSGLIILFIFVTDVAAGITKPYLGILLYLVLPAVLITGLCLIPSGMYLRWRTFQGKGETPYVKWPSVDLNNKRQRNAALLFVLGTIMFLFISTVGTYRAYQYMDSVEFCGLTCHRVMAPEYTTYVNSPHARVKCVGCHIGAGAGWYAKSKVSGLYQVYATIAGVYPRPIPIPIKDLRPVRQNCEQCHWPKQFFGSRQRMFNHYLYDDANTYWGINMLIKTGGDSPGTASVSGIHWHTNPAVEVEYIARDKQGQDIPWVRVTDRKTGKSIVYQDSAGPLSKKEREAAEPETMDCISCHNQPSHAFHSPDYEIDLAIAAGLIDRSLPGIKTVSVNAMARAYTSEAKALKEIAAGISDFYRTNYPDVLRQRGTAVRNAVLATQTAFRKHVFPDMKARWSDYPNNIGHFMTRGCMRCHDGGHKASNGSVIPNDCRTCHIILSQGGGDLSKVRSEDLGTGIDFTHPVDIGEAWRGGVCYECHEGVQP
jgi:nitrate/TMAO reductase-like tetraheme cytochrome c subunit